MRIIDRIEKYGPCAGAQKWLGRRSNVERAWRECPDGRWMVWLLGELHIARQIDRPTLVLAVCAVARLALPRTPTGEHRPRIAVETTERWCRGEATIAEVRAALNKALEYRWYSNCPAAIAAAEAAAAVIYADAAAADAAAACANYADAAAAACAADTAACADYAAARTTARTDAADAIRSVVPASVIKKALGVKP